MQTETRNSRSACLKHGKTKSESFTIGRQMTRGYSVYSVLFTYTHQRSPPIFLLTLYRLDIANFVYPLSFNALVQGDPLRIYGKALQFLKLEFSRQPTVKIW